MERKAVDSSNLVSIGYDAKERTLEVEFNGKSVYQYFDVPLNIYKDLMDSDSKGKFFAKFVKGAYDYKRA